MRFRERKEVRKLYKREGGEGRKGGWAVSVTLRYMNSDLIDLLVRSWDTQLREEWYLGLAR
jgi:hypothetical protein